MPKGWEPSLNPHSEEQPPHTQGMLLSQAMQKGNNLAHHLIQSFAPGETTPEQAHEIGRQLADEVLQGKYPYVLTTHIDKGHVHNHIIFCAVDMVNQRKYVSNRQSYAYIRRTSDRLCKEYGLSVVMPGQDRGKSYAEWDAHRKGTSWKAKLKAAIDAAIPQATFSGTKIHSITLFFRKHALFDQVFQTDKIRISCKSGKRLIR